MAKNALFSEMVKASDRTFFLDIKEASNGSHYISITESKKAKEGDNYENTRMLLFQNDVTKFQEAFNRLVANMPAPIPGAGKPA